MHLVILFCGHFIILINSISFYLFFNYLFTMRKLRWVLLFLYDTFVFLKSKIDNDILKKKDRRSSASLWYGRWSGPGMRKKNMRGQTFSLHYELWVKELKCSEKKVETQRNMLKYNPITQLSCNHGYRHLSISRHFSCTNATTLVLFTVFKGRKINHNSHTRNTTKTN